MRAVVYDRYGSPDVLRLEEVERPVPGEDEVLIAEIGSAVTEFEVGDHVFGVAAVSCLRQAGLRKGQKILENDG